MDEMKLSVHSQIPCNYCDAIRLQSIELSISKNAWEFLIYKLHLQVISSLRRDPEPEGPHKSGD